MGDRRIFSAAARLVLKALNSAPFWIKGCVLWQGMTRFLGQHGVAMMAYGILSGSRTPGELGLWA